MGACPPFFFQGARIDHAHHDNNAKRALLETLAFEEAVKEAMNLTNEEDTLMIVTSDHSHVFNIAGHPKRGNDILGNVLLYTIKQETVH